MQATTTIIMEQELKSLLKVTAYTTSLMAYSRLASSSTTPGLPRLLALLPALLVLPFLPLHFHSLHLRSVSTFLLSWLSLFKLLLLAFASGPLASPSLTLLPFIATAALPVKLQRRSSSNKPKQKAKPISLLLTHFFIPFFIKILILFLALSLYQLKPLVPTVLLLCLYSLHLYLSLDLILSSSSLLVGALLGIDLDPQFHSPLMSNSLQEFWGRRWNLMVPDILRPSVYYPVKALYGVSAGVMAAFIVSGIMHEVLYCYLQVAGVRGEAFFYFLSQGFCTLVEEKARRSERWQWWRRMPPVVLRVSTVGFVTVTSSYSLLQPIVRSGYDERVIEESKEIMGFFVGGLRAGILWIWGFIVTLLEC